MFCASETSQVMLLFKSDVSFSLKVGETETRLECLLNNNKNSDFCAPLTSFDWNEVDPYLLGEIDKRLCFWHTFEFSLMKSGL